MKRTYILILFLITISVAGQSKIGGAKENLSGGTQNSGGRSYSLEEEKSSNASPSSSYSGSFLGEIFGGLLIDLTVGLAYSIVVQAPNEHTGLMHQSTLNPYPFHGNTKGDYQYAGWDNFVLWRLEASNYYFSEKGNFFLNDLNLKFRITDRFAVNAEYFRFWEKLLLTGNEKMDMFSTTFQYYRIRTPRVSVHWGLGASYIANEVKKFGLATEIANEIFIKPISIYTDLKANFFKNDQIYLFSIGPKYYYRNFNIGVKYQYVNLASYKSSGISLGIGFIF